MCVCACLRQDGWTVTTIADLQKKVDAAKQSSSKPSDKLITKLSEVLQALFQHMCIDFMANVVGKAGLFVLMLVM